MTDFLFDIPSVSLNGYFKEKYPDRLTGSDWLLRIPAEERKAFNYVGRMCSGHGKLGGKARAASAFRDERGRFVSRLMAETLGLVMMMPDVVGCLPVEIGKFESGSFFVNDPEVVLQNQSIWDKLVWKIPDQCFVFVENLCIAVHEQECTIEPCGCEVSYTIY